MPGTYIVKVNEKKYVCKIFYESINKISLVDSYTSQRPDTTITHKEHYITIVINPKGFSDVMKITRIQNEDDAFCKFEMHTSPINSRVLSNISTMDNSMLFSVFSPLRGENYE